MDLKKIKNLNGKSLNELSPEEKNLFAFLQKNSHENKIKVSVTSEAPQSELSQANSEKKYYEILANYNNKIAVHIEDDVAMPNMVYQTKDGEVILGGESDNISLIDTLKNSVVFWVFFVAAVGSLLTSESDNGGGNEQTTVSKEQKNAAKKVITISGYKCDQVDSIIQSSWDGSYSVTCNGYRYMYEIKDKGGNWVVTLDD